MNIKYRLSKEELYDMIRYNLCETRSKKFNYICSDITLAIITLGTIFIFVSNYSTGISNIIKCV